MAVGDANPEGVAIAELGVAPLTDPETDLEDELPTPDDSPSGSASGRGGGSVFRGFVLRFQTHLTWS